MERTSNEGIIKLGINYLSKPKFDCEILASIGKLWRVFLTTFIDKKSYNKTRSVPFVKHIFSTKFFVK